MRPRGSPPTTCRTSSAKGISSWRFRTRGCRKSTRSTRTWSGCRRETGIPLVATNDCHYLTQEDARAQEVLVCIQTGKTLSDPNRMKFPTDQFYFKTYEEMAAVFSEIPDAVTRTLEIAERCNVHLEKKEHVFPHFEVPPGETLDSFFERVTRQGFAMRPRAAGTAARPPGGCGIRSKPTKTVWIWNLS